MIPLHKRPYATATDLANLIGTDIRTFKGFLPESLFKKVPELKIHKGKLFKPQIEEIQKVVGTINGLPDHLSTKKAPK